MNPQDPLPSSLLGGMDVDDFLAQQLVHSADPNASGLGILVDKDSTLGDSSICSVPWSVSDPNRSFYEEVYDLIASSTGPALPSDAVRLVPRLVEQKMVVRGVQTYNVRAMRGVPVSASDKDSPAVEYQAVSQVDYFLCSILELNLIF